MGSNDEPSNPFSKNPKKAASTPNNRNPKQKRNDSKRAPKGPPTPPGKSAKAPPVAPTSSKPVAEKSGTAPAPTRAPGRTSKSVGLRKQSSKRKAELQSKTDEKARQLIEASRAKSVAKPADRADAKPTTKKEPTNPFKKTQSSGPRPAPRRGGRFNKRNKPQGPSKRVQKLHRGKYMEFKYDVRKILDEESVEDEHRSNILGQTWAKGERQSVSDAKEFLVDKVNAGIISEVCSKRIIKLIDSLTTRR
ncbi:MAG: Uncharacterised protein [Marine Group II euryarchaeote MED-G33]|nr:MAG: Uncharacterised protein [Marine Group II euryarchaeote MED-G33]